MSNERNKALKVIHDFCEASKKKDPDAVLEFYTEDAIMIPTGKPIIRGQDAVRSVFSEIYNYDTMEIQSHNEKIEVTGNVAFYYSTYYHLGKDGQTLAKGNTMNILQRDETKGDWKITHDMWS